MDHCYIRNEPKTKRNEGKRSEKETKTKPNEGENEADWCALHDEPSQQVEQEQADDEAHEAASQNEDAEEDCNTNQ